MMYLWRFSCRSGYYIFDGLFKATKDEVDAIIGKTIIIPNFFDRYSSGIEIDINWYMIELISDNPIIIKTIPETGYNPMNYIGEE